MCEGKFLVSGSRQVGGSVRELPPEGAVVLPSVPDPSRTAAHRHRRRTRRARSRILRPEHVLGGRREHLLHRPGPKPHDRPLPQGRRRAHRHPQRLGQRQRRLQQSARHERSSAAAGPSRLRPTGRCCAGLSACGAAGRGKSVISRLVTRTTPEVVRPVDVRRAPGRTPLSMLPRPSTLLPLTGPVARPVGWCRVPCSALLGPCPRGKSALRLLPGQWALTSSTSRPRSTPWGTTFCPGSSSRRLPSR